MIVGPPKTFLALRVQFNEVWRNCGQITNAWTPREINEEDASNIRQRDDIMDVCVSICIFRIVTAYSL
jgi:hypothetical protein